MSFHNSSEQENYGARHSDSASKKTNERHSSFCGCAAIVLIIGFLVAIAAPFFLTRLGGQRELTNIIEVQQLNAAVERFNTDYSFYPPAIGPGLEVDSAEALLQYLDKIAPNHAEGNGVDGGGLEKWWANVGQHLDERSSLVFWLSGLCNSKKYPLSGNSALRAPLAAYNTDKFFDGSEFTDDKSTPLNINLDRNVFFDFRQAQLVSIRDGVHAGIKGYNQPTGSGDFVMFEYRDFRSYNGSTPNSVLKTAYHHGVDDDGNPNFYNPTSFQIVGPGMDGKMSDQATANTNLTDSASIDPAQNDNITNLSNGRLEKSFDK